MTHLSFALDVPVDAEQAAYVLGAALFAWCALGLIWVLANALNEMFR